MIEEKRYDQTNALAFISKFEYNASGQKISWKVYSIRNKLHRTDRLRIHKRRLTACA
jgi:hypothetical protein